MPRGKSSALSAPCHAPAQESTSQLALQATHGTQPPLHCGSTPAAGLLAWQWPSPACPSLEEPSPFCSRDAENDPSKHWKPPGCHSAGRISSMAGCRAPGGWLSRAMCTPRSLCFSLFLGLWSRESFLLHSSGILVWSAAVLWNGVMQYEVCPAGKKTVWEWSWQEFVVSSAPIPAVLESPRGARQRASRAVSHAQCAVQQWYLP